MPGELHNAMPHAAVAKKNAAPKVPPSTFAAATFSASDFSMRSDMPNAALMTDIDTSAKVDFLVLRM